MIAAVLPALALLLCALFAANATTHGRFVAKDRLQLLLAGLTASVLLFAVQRVTDWSERWLLGLWWLSVALLAAGAAATTLRWSHLAWLRNPDHALRRRTTFGINALALLAITIAVA